MPIGASVPGVAAAVNGVNVPFAPDPCPPDPCPVDSPSPPVCPPVVAARSAAVVSAGRSFAGCASWVQRLNVAFGHGS